MKLKRYVVALLMASSLTPLAMAQSGMNLPPTEQYVPRLGDIMNAIQQRHMKLWFAGKAGIGNSRPTNFANSSRV